MEELIIPAKIENLEAVQSFLKEKMEAYNCTKKDIGSIQIVAEEVFVNISSYAYGENSGDATVRIQLEGQPPEIYLEFRDSGLKYDPLEKQDPDISMDIMERSIGGLGIFMVKEIMDSVNYQYKDGMNILSMKKTGEEAE